MRAPVGPPLVAAGLTILLATAAIVTLTPPDGPRSLPPAVPLPLAVGDPERAATLEDQGVRLSAGWTPTGLLIGDASRPEDPWSVASGPSGVAVWTDSLPRLRLTYDAAGRLFVEDAVVVPDPAHCYHLARIVRRVGVGLPPPAGPRIAEQLEAWLEPPYFSAAPDPSGRWPCAARDRSHWGFAIEQAEPLPCEVPGRQVICFTLAKWRYDFGPRDLWTSTHRTFDVMTGERLDDQELHPGLDLIAFEVLVDEAICALGGVCGGLPAREGRIHPTRTTVVVELSPGEAAAPEHGSLRLTIPRRSLPVIPEP